MKSNLQQLTASILLLTGGSVMAEGPATNLAVPSLLAEYMTQDYSKIKIGTLFQQKIFELDQAKSRIIVDPKKLHQAATLNNDQQLLQLVKSLRELAVSDVGIEIVDPKDMVASTQDRTQ